MSRFFINLMIFMIFMLSLSLLENSSYILEYGLVFTIMMVALNITLDHRELKAEFKPKEKKGSKK